MVAILLAGGVLLGFLALVVDVGQIYVEREELQSGADAAAVGVARACATSQDACDSTAAIVALAQQYADANASDKTSQVAEVCGRLSGKLADCGAPNDNLTDCLGTPPAAPTLFVQVRLGTHLPDDRFVLPPTFAQTLAGNSSYTGTSVGACARATWVLGVPDVLALTISTCEFSHATNHGTSYGPAPPYPPDPSSVDEYVIGFNVGEEGGCGQPDNAGFWQQAGPAGFLNPTTTTCEVDVPGNGQLWGTYLNSLNHLPPNGCEERLRHARSSREVVYLMVHDAVHSGAHDGAAETFFRGVYLVPFVVTGFSFGSEHSAESWLRSPPAIPCVHDTGGETGTETGAECVSGVFVGPPIPLVGLAGRAIVRLIG